MLYNDGMDVLSLKNISFLIMATFSLSQKLQANSTDISLKSTAILADEVLTDLTKIEYDFNLSSTCLIENPVFKATAISQTAQKISPELIAPRELSPFMKTCFDSIKSFDAPVSFEDAIRISIELNLAPQENMLPKDILTNYDVSVKTDAINSTGVQWNENVGLFSHPMCEKTDQYFISRNENSKKDRIKNGEAKMQEFIKEYNKLYNAYKNAVNKGDSIKSLQLQKEMKIFYFNLLASMALHESLSDANNSQQEDLSKIFSQTYGIKNGYVRPSGVKFYYDKTQSEEVSRQNIGLYQFTPKRGGNVDACYHAWNNVMGKKSQACKIDLKLSNKESFEFISASDQMFNAFCGANKLLQSFGVQVNATNLKNPSASAMQLTHSANKDKKGLKETKDRCISPFVYSSNAYMHFGVLGFTTYSEGKDNKPGSNTQSVLTTALDAQK